MFRNKKNKNGFTVAEVLVAAAIFMVFSGALFSIYRMGSRMFVSGSWKFNRQKEAERFFEILKERVEQASNIVKIQPSAEKKDQIKTDHTTFKTKVGNLVALSSGQRAGSSNLQLTEFAVCKPCQILSPTNTKNGIIVLHSLTLVPNSTTGLYELCFRVKRIGDNTHNEFFGLGCADHLSMSLSDFQADPSEFGLQPVPTVYTLRDVASLTIRINRGEEEASARDDYQAKAIRPSLFDIRVGMRNPKHEQTVLEMGYKFKIDGSVEVEAVN